MTRNRDPGGRKIGEKWPVQSPRVCHRRIIFSSDETPCGGACHSLDVLRVLVWWVWRKGSERHQGTDATEADERTREEETATDQLPVYKEQWRAKAELPVACCEDDNQARLPCVPVCCILWLGRTDLDPPKHFPSIYLHVWHLEAADLFAVSPLSPAVDCPAINRLGTLGGVHRARRWSGFGRGQICGRSTYCGFSNVCSVVAKYRSEDGFTHTGLPTSAGQYMYWPV